MRNLHAQRKLFKIFPIFPFSHYMIFLLFFLFAEFIFQCTHIHIVLLTTQIQGVSSCLYNKIET